MPYIYSLAWKTTHEGYSIMRPLVMDFREDVRAQNVGDQFLFGPAILVNPVTEPGASMRRLYLPKAEWFDFWTGESVEGGKAIEAPTPIERLPLYVKAGSILPLGPDVEYAAEKPADPLELRIYPGADGSFTLYEDENDTYNYEKGVYSTISLQWSESSKTLAIGHRSGAFPGMLESRTLRVVVARKGHGTGGEITGEPDRIVNYVGKAMQVSFK
jgi:alpha-D-xyloside xylohydrolase